MKDQKTVEVVVRFWTNGLPKSESPILAWESGVVYMIANPTLGIKSTKMVHFHSLSELPAAIAKATALADLALVKYGRIRKSQS